VGTYDEAELFGRVTCKPRATADSVTPSRMAAVKAIQDIRRLLSCDYKK
jgi:hypothetical protein